MVIYFKCLFDVVEANSKMKANNSISLFSSQNLLHWSHYSSDTHLHWVSWKDMFENGFFWWGEDTNFHMLYFMPLSLTLFYEWQITPHVLLSQDCEKYLCVELNIFPTQVFIKEKWLFIFKMGCVFFGEGVEKSKVRSNIDMLSNNKEGILFLLTTFCCVLCALHMHLCFFTIPCFELKHYT